MGTMKKTLLLLMSLALTADLFALDGRSSIAIQPIGEVEASLIALARQAISDTYGEGSTATMAWPPFDQPISGLNVGSCRGIVKMTGEGAGFAKSLQTFDNFGTGVL